jgi:hypothetical protein
MIYIVVTASSCELDASDEEKIEFALDEIMTEVGFSDYNLQFE